MRSATDRAKATAVQVDVAGVTSKALLGMVHLPDGARIQLTALNFSCQPVAGGVRSEHLPPGATVVDMSTDQVVAEVDREHSFTISLAPHQGMSLLAVPG